MDENALMDFVGRFVGDLGATVAAGAVVVGDALGLYEALAATGPCEAGELAAATETAPRYVEEWLRGQAAGGYVQYHAATSTYSMTEEQAFALTDPTGPLFMPGAFQLALGALAAVPRAIEAFRDGDGIAWQDHDTSVFLGCERFFRPGYVGNLVSSWLPALDGVEPKLHDGAAVADIGCGLGASTILMAQAYPRSTFTGSDCHEQSVTLARKRSAEAGLTHRVEFDVANAADFGGGPYDLVTTFDCLHDMGDPVSAALNVRNHLADDGTWMVVEPLAGDTVEANLTAVGRVYYSFSTFLCVPNAVAQGGARTLGAQAGPAAIEAVTREAGFRHFRTVASTPFNLVYEVRP